VIIQWARANAVTHGIDARHNGVVISQTGLIFTKPRPVGQVNGFGLVGNGHLSAGIAQEHCPGVVA